MFINFESFIKLIIFTNVFLSTPNLFSLFPVEICFNVSASVDGDPGYWGYEGPGDLSFSNPTALSTLVTPEEYGIYTITYYGCGTSSSLNVNIQSIQPQIISFPEEPILCDFSANFEPKLLTVLNPTANSRVTTSANSWFILS